MHDSFFSECFRVLHGDSWSNLTMFFFFSFCIDCRSLVTRSCSLQFFKMHSAHRRIEWVWNSRVERLTGWRKIVLRHWEHARTCTWHYISYVKCSFIAFESVIVHRIYGIISKYEAWFDLSGYFSILQCLLDALFWLHFLFVLLFSFSHSVCVHRQHRTTAHIFHPIRTRSNDYWKKVIENNFAVNDIKFLLFTLFEMNSTWTMA